VGDLKKIEQFKVLFSALISLQFKIQSKATRLITGLCDKRCYIERSNRRR